MQISQHWATAIGQAQAEATAQEAERQHQASGSVWHDQICVPRIAALVVPHTVTVPAIHACHSSTTPPMVNQLCTMNCVIPSSVTSLAEFWTTVYAVSLGTRPFRLSCSNLVSIPGVHAQLVTFHTACKQAELGQVEYHFRIKLILQSGLFHHLLPTKAGRGGLGMRLELKDSTVRM